MGWDRAVIAGGSTAGMLAAAALHRRFDEVVIIERDDLPDGPEPALAYRRDCRFTPCWRADFEAMEALLPGVGNDLIAAAGGAIDSAAEIAILGREGWAARVESSASVVGLRRPELEHIVRQRVRQLDNVRHVDGDVVGLVADEDGGVVLGFETRDGLRMLGDLCVDATGRNSKSGRWIADLGYEPPEVRELKSYVGYASVKVKVSDGVLPPGVCGVLTHLNPATARVAP